MSAYYNENEPRAAAWLRELIKDGHIANGDVDERSILDVRSTDLVGYTQCHFFAGIGGWSLALRLAGWPDGRPVWTGSCPCQPFSVAGKGKGADDKRHLWPVFRELIRESEIDVTFGEQVAGAAGLRWLAGVHLDLENMGLRFGAADLCAAGAGAPHIRQRLYWVADTERDGGRADEPRRGPEGGEANGRPGWLDHPQRPGLEVGDWQREQYLRQDAQPVQAGAWSRYDVIPCRDGKARRIESGTFPLATGVPKGLGYGRDNSLPHHPMEARTARLRGYGNSIVPQVAAEFIKAYMEVA